MLLLRNAQTTTHTHDEVISHVAQHATRYDITPVAHRFFAENPRDHRDICHDFGSLTPPDGDTYFEFDLPPYVRLAQQLLLDQSGVRTVGVLVQKYAREDLAGVEYLICTLPSLARRRARAKTTQVLSATFLLELLSDKPTVFAPVMRRLPARSGRSASRTELRAALYERRSNQPSRERGVPTLPESALACFRGGADSP